MFVEPARRRSPWPAALATLAILAGSAAALIVAGDAPSSPARPVPAPAGVEPASAADDGACTDLLDEWQRHPDLPLVIGVSMPRNCTGSFERLHVDHAGRVEWNGPGMPDRTLHAPLGHVLARAVNRCRRQRTPWMASWTSVRIGDEPKRPESYYLTNPPEPMRGTPELAVALLAELDEAIATHLAAHPDHAPSGRRMAGIRRRWLTADVNVVVQGDGRLTLHRGTEEIIGPRLGPADTVRAFDWIEHHGDPELEPTSCCMTYDELVGPLPMPRGMADAVHASADTAGWVSPE